jgi:hypothetical protein
MERDVGPCCILSNDELTALKIPDSELWRVVRFEVSNEGWISWLHEREWRCKGDFTLLRRYKQRLCRRPPKPKS